MSQSMYLICDRASRKQNRLQRAAKEAYGVFCSCFVLPAQPAWEQLNDTNQAAWKAVVSFLLENGECLDCGTPLTCSYVYCPTNQDSDE